MLRLPELYLAYVSGERQRASERQTEKGRRGGGGEGKRGASK